MTLPDPSSRSGATADSTHTKSPRHPRTDRQTDVRDGARDLSHTEDSPDRHTAPTSCRGGCTGTSGSHRLSGSRTRRRAHADTQCTSKRYPTGWFCHSGRSRGPRAAIATHPRSTRRSLGSHRYPTHGHRQRGAAGRPGHLCTRSSSPNALDLKADTLFRLQLLFEVAHRRCQDHNRLGCNSPK